MKNRTIPIAVIALAVLAGCGGAKPSAPAPTPTPVSVTSPAAKTSASSTPVTSYDPNDMGAPTPDAQCATNRLGKTFIRDGVTYRCSAPKPYRWRRV